MWKTRGKINMYRILYRTADGKLLGKPELGKPEFR
jgi:hypothetical protein